MRHPFKAPTAARLPERGKVIPFHRPVRQPTSAAPEHLVRSTEASLRATDVYLRIVTFRLELARRSSNPAELDGLDAAALLRIAVASGALQDAAENALVQIDGQAASRARLAAEMAREGVPHGR
jgi:hypothetical protein